MNIFQRIGRFIRSLFNFRQRWYKAASKDRKSAHWITQEQTPNASLSEVGTIRARSNYLYWNDPFIRGAVDMLINRMIGAGSVPQARTDNEAFNTQIENVFRSWCENADYHGQMHFSEIERFIMQRLFLDGGAFVKIVVDNRRKNPFCLEVIEYNRLAPEGTPLGRNQNIHGVEIDSTGRVVAYHFYSNAADVSGDSTTRRVPADSVIHFSPFRRPGQLLGVPLLAPCIPYAMHLAEILEAELIAKKVEACFGLAIRTTDMLGRMQHTTTTENGTREIEIAPGMVEFLAPGEEVEVIDPKRPGRSFREFVYFVLEGVARGLGLSLEQITGDKSEVNYSSARHSELELRDHIKPFLAADERYFLCPVWRMLVDYSILAGLVKAPGFVASPENYYKHEWIHKGHDWVDPQKEINAKINELLIGATTLSEICAQKGKDWQEVIKQRAREKEFINSLGLNDVSQVEELRSIVGGIYGDKA